VKRVIAALILLTCLAPRPAWSQMALRIDGPVDLGSAFYRDPISRPDLLAADPGEGLVGLTVPLGRGSFSAGYLRNRDLFQSDANGRKLAYGYYHLLAKDTTFYVVGSRLRNGVTVRYQTVLPGRPRQLISIGIRHQF
jgi:hypothetical protein